MKKSKLILTLLCLLASRNAIAIDLDNGVWKNLNEKYQQTTQNTKLIDGMMSNRIYYDNTYDSNVRGNEFSDTFLKNRTAASLRLNGNFSVKAVAKFEKVDQVSETQRRDQLVTGSGDRSFENEGGYLDELVLNYNYKNFSALAGKFNPNFGYAWKTSNGIWVNEIAKQYETDEKLGFGAIQRFGDRKIFGEYVFGASVFTNDRKNLDNSIITKRDGVSKSEGEPGDTRNLDSYVLSTDIYYDFGNDEKLSYHFSYLNLAINDRQNKSNVSAKINDEKAFALNMEYEYPINDNFLLDSFVEYTKIDNLGGDIERESQFLTVNFTTRIYKYFSITLARANEKQIKVGENGVDKHINEISFGYKFDQLSQILKGLSLEVGYQESEVDDKINPIKDKSFGAVLRHKIEF